MRYAIDRLNAGFEMEVCADDFDGEYSVRLSNRFFCPEYGESVFWKSKGGRKTRNEFSHYRNSPQAPECDKRVDGNSSLYVYQRVGLPMKIARRGDTFFLYMNFPAISNTLIETAINQKAKVTISANKLSKSFPINFTYFQADKQTLLPLDFVPIGGNYSVSVSGTIGILQLKQKWSDYSDGFSYAGAIFTNEDDGARKVRRGDSITTGKRYYLISKDYRPIYKEIEIAFIGNITLNNSVFNVYELEVNVSVYDEYLYTSISNHLKQCFGVWLLETVPELIPLWPPVTDQDVSVPVADCGSVICAVSSGNSTPRVFHYERNRAITVPIKSDESENNTVELPLYHQQATIVSVDRKYVGREAVFFKRPIDYNGCGYDISLLSNNGNLISENDLISKTHRKNAIVQTNAKFELYLKTRDFVITHLSIRETQIRFPDCDHLQEIIFTVEQGILKKIALQNSRPTEHLLTPQTPVINTIKSSDYVPIPRWVGYLLSEWKKNGDIKTVQEVSSFFNQGKMPYQLLKEMMNYLFLE